jgi:hypothetical protein
VKELTGATVNGTTVTLSFSEVASIEAGKPYIVKWASGDDITDPEFTGVTISSSTPEGVTFSDVTFQGTYEPIQLTKDDPSNLYLGGDNKLYYPVTDAAATLNAFRAWFKITDGSGARMNYVVDLGDGEATAITTTTAVDNDAAGAYYDLSGRRIDGRPTEKGIYVRNGRKEVVK